MKARIKPHRLLINQLLITLILMSKPIQLLIQAIAAMLVQVILIVIALMLALGIRHIVLLPIQLLKQNQVARILLKIPNIMENSNLIKVIYMVTIHKLIKIEYLLNIVIKDMVRLIMLYHLENHMVDINN